MGRIFETRKATMMARWDRMAKAFTRVAKEIAMAVKAGGAMPENNPALRRAIQNARAVNMPKDKVQSAIARASGQGGEAYQEILYEGYGPHGVAFLIETATDNPVRTVGNLRAWFTRGGGNLASSGSVAFLFKRMGVFRLKAEGIDQEALELDLIDYGLEELGESVNDKGETELVIRCAFTDFGRLQRAIEDASLALVSAQAEYIAENAVTLEEDAVADVDKLVDRFEQDDDVQRVFTNLG